MPYADKDKRNECLKCNNQKHGISLAEFLTITGYSFDHPSLQPAYIGLGC